MDERPEKEPIGSLYRLDGRDQSLLPRHGGGVKGVEWALPGARIGCTIVPLGFPGGGDCSAMPMGFFSFFFFRRQARSASARVFVSMNCPSGGDRMVAQTEEEGCYWGCGVSRRNGSNRFSRDGDL
jgi:sugar lactone lactonase YvrE